MLFFVCICVFLCVCVRLFAWIQDSGIDFGDISERKALRKRLQCKTFRWYLVNIYPEMRMYSETIAYGVVSRLHFSSLIQISVQKQGQAILEKHRFNPVCFDLDDCNQEHRQGKIDTYLKCRYSISCSIALQQNVIKSREYLACWECFLFARS